MVLNSPPWISEGKAIYAHGDVDAIRTRLEKALEILESPTVISGESLASFMSELAQRSV